MNEHDLILLDSEQQEIEKQLDKDLSNQLFMDSVSCSISCNNCKYFYAGLGFSQGKECRRNNTTSLLGIDTRTYSCSDFKSTD